MEAIRKLSMSLEKTISSTKIPGTPPPGDLEGTVPKHPKPDNQKSDTPHTDKGEDEKEDRRKIKFNLDEI